MLEDLERKLVKIERNVGRLGDKAAVNPSLITDINAQFAAFDTLVEFYSLPEELVARYNMARMSYGRFFDNAQFYTGLDRTRRIERIAEHVDQIVDTQEFLQACVANQEAQIDILAANMEAGALHVQSAVAELETAKRRVSVRRRLWRYAACFVGLCVGMFTYRVFF